MMLAVHARSRHTLVHTVLCVLPFVAERQDPRRGIQRSFVTVTWNWEPAGWFPRDAIHTLLCLQLVRSNSTGMEASLSSSSKTFALDVFPFAWFHSLPVDIVYRGGDDAASARATDSL